MEQERRKGKAYATSAKCGKVAGGEGGRAKGGDWGGGGVSELGVAGADCLLEFLPFRHLPFADHFVCVCVARCTLHTLHVACMSFAQSDNAAIATASKCRRGRREEGGRAARRPTGSAIGGAAWQTKWRHCTQCVCASMCVCVRVCRRNVLNRFFCRFPHSPPPLPRALFWQLFGGNCVAIRRRRSLTTYPKHK